MVSILIPARNEESVIARAVRSALHQSYDKVEVIVLNDGSTDETGAILNELKLEHPDKLTLIEGTERPEGWLGKNFACWQLAKTAKGDFLVFIDADVWLEPNTIERLLTTFERNPKAGLITVWPQQHLLEPWEQRVIPLVYQALLGLLPAIYTERKPRWMPGFAYKYVRHWFAAACGQFMAFRRDAYDAIQGHESVCNKVVEDVELAKQVLKNGFSLCMRHGVNSVHCRMYQQPEEMRSGFRKNFLAGFGFNVPLFLLMGALNALAYLLPWLMLFIALATNHVQWLLLSLSTLSITAIHRMLLFRWFNWKGELITNQFLGVLWFQNLAVTVLIDYFTKRPVTWKNRVV